jgi:hypothetical protein
MGISAGQLHGVFVPWLNSPYVLYVDLIKKTGAVKPEGCGFLDALCLCGDRASA